MRERYACYCGGVARDLAAGVPAAGAGSPAGAASSSSEAQQVRKATQPQAFHWAHSTPLPQLREENATLRKALAKAEYRAEFLAKNFQALRDSSTA